MIGVAGVATAGAAVLGMTPTLSASPELAANVYYLRGTNIGDEPTDIEYRDFMGRVLDGTNTPLPAGGYDQVVYNAGFWPVSRNGLDDLKWDASVQEGIDSLDSKAPGSGDVVFGFSQGAVAISKYREDPAHQNTGATYVLVENPNRANGGLLPRFEGLTIPILDITFTGATPDTDDDTIDIARQYSGWSDFPTYPLNLLATANAVAGIYYLHGNTQRQLTEADLEAARNSGNPDYYQSAEDNGTNTTYYLIPTDRLPLLMPFTGIVPENVLDAVDAPLRVLVEAGYDRSDYSKPTRAQLIPKVNPVDLAKDLADATAQGIAAGLKQTNDSAPTAASFDTSEDRDTPESPKLNAAQLPAAPKLSKLALRQQIPTHRDSQRPAKQEQPRESRRLTNINDPGTAIRTTLESLSPKKLKPKPEKPSGTPGPSGATDGPNQD